MKTKSESGFKHQRTSLECSSVGSLLHEFLVKRELSAPNGQPLFKYQLSESEYHSLGSSLRNKNIPFHPHSDSRWCAAFCLFSAEWYRREYQGGWNWSGISNSLGFELDANQRSQIVKKGFSYWERPVSQYSDERYSFLGSVFREGGLPYGLLAGEGGQFQSIFKRILRVYDEAQLSGQSPFQLVSQSLEHFPEAFRQETTVDLITKMAELLLRLTDEYNLQQQGSPANHLDSQLPGWRSLFPIPLDGETGSELLSGLLASASHQRRRTEQQKQRIVCTQRLANCDGLGFITRIKLMKSVPMPFTRSELINSRVELFIREGSRVIAELGIGHTAFEGDSNKAKVIVRTQVCEFRRQAIDQDLYLVIQQAGTEIHREVIPDSGLSVNEMPVVLKSDGEHDQVIGQGSVSKKADRLKVILPKEVNYKVEFPEQCIAAVIDHQYQYIEFNGELEVNYGTENDEPDNYIISTRQSAFVFEHSRLQGEVLQYNSSTGQPIYLGLPDIPIPAQEQNSELWIGNKPAREAHLAELFGLQPIRMKSGCRTLFRKRLAILPESFKVKLTPSNQADKGYIDLFCERCFLVSTEEESISLKQHNIDGGKRLEVTATGTPPADIILAVSANLMAQPIKIRLPFPFSGALIFDKHGDRLANRVTIEALLGARIQFFPRLGGVGNYHIELKGPANARDASYFWEYKVTDRALEVNLYEFRHHIRQLLAASGELDDEVRMLVGGTGCQEKQIIIGRYATEAQLENGAVRFDTQHRNGQNIKPELINLTDPAARAHSLQPRYSDGVPTGVFELNIMLSYPALVVPSQTSQLAFRAKFIPAFHRAEYSQPVSTLNKAVALFHPESNPNVISEVVQQLSNDFYHSSWRFINDLFDKFSHLPMTTFEVWRAIVKDSSCLTALAFKADNPVLLMERLQVEFNVIWELIPLNLWQDNTIRYRQMLLETGLPKTVVENKVVSKLEALSVFTPLLEKECRHLVVQQYSPNEQMLDTVFQFVLPGWKNDLVRLHLSDRAWPTAFANELGRWCHKHCRSLIHFEVSSSFRKGVLYFPFFAAAVACGKAQLEELVPELLPIHYFYLRQLTEFDRQWFNPVFQSALCYFSREKV